MEGYLWTFDLFAAEEIVLSGNAVSDICDVRSKAPNDKFVIHYTITGTGVLKLEYQSGYYYADTFLTPSSATEIGVGLLVGSDFIPFSPILAPFYKFKATETGGAAAATITAHLLTK